MLCHCWQGQRACGTGIAQVANERRVSAHGWGILFRRCLKTSIFSLDGRDVSLYFGSLLRKVHPPFDEWHSIRVAWPEKCPPSAGTPYYEEGDMTTCAMTVCT